MSDITIEDKKVMTPKFRVSFPHLFEPQSYEGGPAKYGLTMLFPKNVDLKDLKRAAHNAAVEAWGENKEKWPKNRRMPFRDGDRDKPDMKGYPGNIFVTATSKEQPGLVDKDRNAIIQESEFYAGCFARATLIAFVYGAQGGKKSKMRPGVSFALQNVQKLGDGKKFSGRKEAEEEFDSVEDQSEDVGSDDDGDSDDMGF